MQKPVQESGELEEERRGEEEEEEFGGELGSEFFGGEFGGGARWIVRRRAKKEKRKN